MNQCLLKCEEYMEEKRRPGKPVTHPPILHIESGLIFKTYKEAAEYVGGSPNNVYHVVIGIQSHHKGQHFKFAE